MSYETVRDFAAGFGFFFLATTYAVAVAWTFRRRARSAHERAARIIFDEEDRPFDQEDRPSAREIGRGR